MSDPKTNVTIEEFKKLDLRIAEVLSVTAHPKADKLYLLEIRVGEVTKQIVAGIRPHYDPEELRGKKIVVANNLEEAVIRGSKSEGMLLAASDGTRLSLIVPERDISPGSPVT